MLIRVTFTGGKNSQCEFKTVNGELLKPRKTTLISEISEDENEQLQKPVLLFWLFCKKLLCC